MSVEDEETQVHSVATLIPAVEQAPSLVVMTGRNVGCLYKLRPEGMVIGRAPDVDVYLDDDGISRVHCMVCLGIMAITWWHHATRKIV